MSCPICGHRETLVFHSSDAPLSVADLKDTAKESVEMGSYNLKMRICRKCAHVYNEKFSKKEIYSHGCTMYNDGSVWKKAVKNKWRETLENYPFESIVVEVGAGDGSFLADLNFEQKIAFEPSEDAKKCNRKGLKTHQQYFVPRKHVSSLQPDIIILRHVAEHMANPKSFFNELFVSCCDEGISPSVIVEVPCTQNALADVRVEDWVYEHPHHFSYESLTELFSGWRIDSRETFYENEVLLVSAHAEGDSPVNADCAKGSFQYLAKRLEETRSRLKGTNTAYWGGAGKSATLLHALNHWEPRVVDSDKRKVGKYVPGTDKLIESPQALIDKPVDYILITTSWRAKDIEAEIRRKKIPYKRLFTLIQGSLRSV